ncbi:uracil-xanthine permease family protein [Prolixibacter sp. NT017]|uniref:uracil-xanthine permease family protein n=1 Tax=Prolixibacter sp. NT017 TaxID=2652390 RepID=UPI0012991FF3|nr:uracil-xanthine permease family protein [Prolixibacter sp. NT017]
MTSNNLHQQLTGWKRTVLGIQFLFVAFGATVLVPLLVGIDPAVALFTAGVGTLIFHLITRGVVPVFLGSSFAFIAPIIASSEMYGMAGTLGGLMAVGLVYAGMSALIKLRGVRFIERLFPSVVVGPVIIVIGLSLAPTAINMIQSPSAEILQTTSFGLRWLVAAVVLGTAILIVTFGKGMMKLIPIFIGMAVGYFLSVMLGIVDYSAVLAADWFSLPEFTRPEFSWGAILFMIPVAVAPIIEHVGDMYAIGGVVNKNFIEKPGLHRTLLGDGIATFFAGVMGGPPNTTYSEVTGAVSLTKVGDPKVLRIAAITAIVFSLVGKISGFLKTIPEPVLGGIMLLLFGMIASVGIKTLIDSKTNMNITRNQVIVSVVLTLGVGGATLQWGSFSLAGIGLASVVGVVLNLILPGHSLLVQESKEDDIVI